MLRKFPMLTAVKPNKCVQLALAFYYLNILNVFNVTFFCVFIGMLPLEIALTISPSSTVCKESGR